MVIRSRCFFFCWFFFLSSFTFVPYLSFNMMEALSSLPLRPPSSSCFGLVPQMAHNPFDVSSSFGGKVGPFTHSLF